MTILRYKDFQGSATFEEGRILVQILHIDDFITSECDRASEVQPAFEGLVDEYLETCASIGKEPCRPYRGVFNVRVAPDLHRRAVHAATDAHLTLNAWVERAIKEKVG